MEISPKITKYVTALALSVPLITIYFLSMFIPIKFEWGFIENPRIVAVATFYALLIMLIIRELITSSRTRDVVTILLILVASFYSYTAGIYFELNYLASQRHIVVPPSFIYIPCSDASRCNNFAALSISVPLTIEFVLMIYGAVGLSKALTPSPSTRAIKNP